MRGTQPERGQSELDESEKVGKKMSEQLQGQMTVEEYIEWIESLEEFAQYMNKPEKEEP